ncbi:hypothetical protein OHB04_22695 [Streptomyces sp. NBC_01775]|uniref:hypothetical protein n=1 Tax=Streptomyces sp. NBC_01775 TaxID=2975939 RepID=UPI002DDC3193|nr:hypothetical protein [Streptomyces sp. NBC_01775]WSB78303.1 hypothetical protein OHB04_22695 [Streptomyces sp. NBC_01775]
MTRTPQETFLSDQSHAAARDLATAGTPVIVLDPATGGQCTWCECDVTIGHVEGRCATPCQGTADLVMCIYRAGGHVRTDIALCSACHPDAMTFVKAVFQAGGFR